MKEIRLNDMSHLSVGQVVDSLSSAYTTYINKNIPLKLFPSVMLWGEPGVGKSEAIREIAQNIKSATHKETIVTDVRLLLFNPIDLRGIPVANQDHTLAVWLKPKIFQMDPSDDVINILFLDEISAAPQSVQAAAYQITLDRVVGEHALPENCIVIAAGNRLTDKSVSYKMPKALANRLLHIEVGINFDSWKDYAISHGVNEKVLGFLCYRPDYLSTFNTSGDNLAFATPRSWIMVSNILNNYSSDIHGVYPLISGLISSGLASEFSTYCKIYSKLPKIEDIADGKVNKIPGSIDELYAVVSNITMKVLNYQDKPSKLKNIINYSKLFPADFSTLMLRSFLIIDPDFKRKLLNMPEFMAWVNTRGSSLNGII